MFKWLRDKLGKEASAERPHTGAGAHGQETLLDGDAIERSFSIEDLLLQDEGRFARKLYFVSLRQVKQALGDAWPQKLSRIQMICETVLRQKIGHRGRFAPHGDDIYTMIFTDMPDDEANLRAHLSAEEIGFRVLGEQFSAGARPELQITAVDAAAVLDSAGRLDEGRLAAAVARGEAVAARDTSSDEGAASEAPEGGGPLLGWRDIQGRGDGDNAGQWQRAEPAGREISAPSLALSYLPVWNSGSEHIDTFIANIRLANADDGAGRGDTRLLDTMAAAALTNVTRGLMRYDHEGGDIRVFLPLYFALIERDALTPFTDQVDETPAPMRRDHMVIEIVDLPKVFERSALARVVADCNARFQAVAVRIQADAAHFEAMADIKPGYVGLDLGRLPRSGALSESEMKPLAAAIKALGATPYVLGLQRREDVAVAITAGFVLAAGPGLAKASPTLSPPRELSHQDLIQGSA